MAGKKPGVMIYFELRGALQVLSNEDKGRLLDAILAYAEDGTDPDLEPGALAAIWALTKPRLDADAQRYADRCAKAKDAINKRWRNTDEYERIQTNSFDTNYNSTTTSTPTASTTSSSSPAASTAEGGAGGNQTTDAPTGRVTKYRFPGLEGLT